MPEPIHLTAKLPRADDGSYDAVGYDLWRTDEGDTLKLTQYDEKGHRLGYALLAAPQIEALLAVLSGGAPPATQTTDTTEE
jgi:hypothetical protein